MEAKRYIEEVESGQITIHDLSEYDGKKMEVILFPVEEQSTETKKTGETIDKYRGILKDSGHYIDPLKFQREARDEWDD